MLADGGCLRSATCEELVWTTRFEGSQLPPAAYRRSRCYPVAVAPLRSRATLLLAQDQVHGPAPPDVQTRPAQVGEDRLSGATAVLQCVGEDGVAFPGSVPMDRP